MSGSPLAILFIATLALVSSVESFMPFLLFGFGGLNEVQLAMLSVSNFRPGLAYCDCTI